MSNTHDNGPATQPEVTATQPEVTAAQSEVAAAQSEDKFLSQRHEFILQYYNMAVKDLERHLSVGWQTIATLAGAIISLSLGQKGDLPIPIAVSAALAVSFWGVLNILDSNYWAARAIAFLANVEAVYFYEDDRRIFNPYAGRHPSLKLMNSLKYQMYVAATFIVISLMFFAAKVQERIGLPTMDAWLRQLGTLRYLDLILWLTPVVILLLGLNVVVTTYLKRLSHYLGFVTECPGPGMLVDRKTRRSLDLADLNVATVSGTERQRGLKEKLEKARKRWRSRRWWLRVFSLLLFAILIAAVFAKEPLIGALYSPKGKPAVQTQ